ncbi:MAG: adenylate/guanylate cyclase domain-containing protein [Phycisphaerales bacterium]
MTRVQWMLGSSSLSSSRSSQSPEVSAPSSNRPSTGVPGCSTSTPSSRRTTRPLLRSTTRPSASSISRRRVSESAQAIDELNARAKTIAIDIIFDQRPRLPITAQSGTRGVHALSANTAPSFATQFEWLATHQDQERGLRVPFQLVYQSLRKNPDLTLPQLVDQCASAPDIPEDIRAELRKDAGPVLDALERSLADARSLITHQSRDSAPIPPGSLPWPASTKPVVPLPQFAESATLASVTFQSFDSDGVARAAPLWVRLEDRLYPTLGLAGAARQLGVTPDSITINQSQTVLAPSGSAQRVMPTFTAPLRGMTDRAGLTLITWPRAGRELPSLTPRPWTGQFDRRDDGSLMTVSLASLVEPYFIADRIKANLRELNRGVEFAVSALGDVIDDPDAFRQRAATIEATDLRDEDWIPNVRAQREAIAGVVDFAKDMAPMVIEATPDLAEAPLDTLLLAHKLATTSDDPDAAARLAELAAQYPSLASLDPDAELLPIMLLRLLAERAPDVIAEIDRAVGPSGQLIRWRQVELPSLVAGRLCFIGWAATGQTADNPRTSIAPQTPGVLVHTAIANSVLTHHARQPAPHWINAVATLTLGLLATWIAVRFAVIVGPFALIMMLAAYFLLNGVWFWDRAVLDVAVGAPFLAATSCWLVVILHRLLVEERGRRRTEQRFRAYVPPDVVDILVNNPSLNSMAPQRRELTILFSDIANFTTLSESLGTERTGLLLATYLRSMTEILQRTRATLDKYLGDGIMAFWGAPLDDPEHAHHAAQAAIEMLDTLDQMNDSGAFKDAGRLNIRIGLATGTVNVGDFGNPPLRSAYTVIGDAANLAARLESANKVLGTNAAINALTRSQLPDSFRVRPVGAIKVKGKNEPEQIYELIAHRAPRGDQTDDWIQGWTDAVAAFQSADVDNCLAILQTIAARFGPEPLIEVYTQTINQWQKSGLPSDQFDATIVLTEK